MSINKENAVGNCISSGNTVDVNNAIHVLSLDSENKFANKYKQGR